MTPLQIDIRNKVYELWAKEEGQDLIEYTILLAFLAVAVAGLLSGAGRSVTTVWSAARTTLSNAAAKAS
jgi:Flp pilus assembly pilin Flp